MENIIPILGWISPFLLAYIGYLFKQKHDLKSKLDNKKQDSSKEVLNLIFETLKTAKTKKNVTIDITKMYNIYKNLILWSSKDVIRAYNKVMKSARNQSSKSDHWETINNLGDLIIALRKDAGHSGNLSRRDVLSLFIPDYDEVTGMYS